MRFPRISSKGSSRVLLAAFVLAALALGPACDSELFGGEEETPSPTQTASPTPTGSSTPTPSPAPTPVVTTDGDITTLDFGTVSLPAGESPTFSFSAPTATIGIDFIVNGAAADRAKYFLLFSVIAPGNRTVIDNTAGGPVRQSPNNGVMSFSLPADDSSTSAVASGTWQFHVAAFDGNGDLVSSNPQLLVKVRTNGGAAVPDGLVDMNVVVVDGAYYDDAEFQGALDVMNALYTNIGLQLGEVTYYSLSDTSFADVSSSAELSELFELTSGISDQRVNIFVVDDLSGELQGAAGVAGGVPIPMDLNGTLHSGVAFWLQGSSTATGEVLAHEVGHSLGLYHTTEFDGSTDEIGDTVSCPAATIDPVTGDPASCPDANNVMFPQITGFFDDLTIGQGIVLRPAIHVRTNTATAFTASAVPVRDAEPGSYLIRCHWNGTHYQLSYD